MAARRVDPEAPRPAFRRFGQVPALDGLRGVAVLLVLLSHTTLLTKPVAASRRTGAFLYLDGFTLFALAVAAVILATLDTDWPVNRLLQWRPLRLVGRVSYGLYLWHLPIFDAVERYGTEWRTPVRVVVAYSLTALFTTLSWVLVERPALRWKRRLDERRTGPLAPSTAEPKPAS